MPTSIVGQPPAAWMRDKMTCAPHCWSSHAVPGTVNVQLSERMIEPEATISFPARTW